MMGLVYSGDFIFLPPLCYYCFCLRFRFQCVCLSSFASSHYHIIPSQGLTGFLGSAGVGLGYVSGMLYNWIGYIARVSFFPLLGLSTSSQFVLLLFAFATLLGDKRMKRFSRYVLIWTWEPDDTWFLDICGRMNTLLFLLYCFCNPRLQLILISFPIWTSLIVAWGDCIYEPCFS
ncbi:hypothetical protein GE21DRAFT_2406 [Neurospora crassa]|uniref:Uncharacterized protein n=1 Tax=Neurospora crassa (strain ATCC 24698 / 74-OR23-1A / CBS 708.71 / DSM 1257 / FGSC 987) TaxID=367110 RepID=V5IRH2_NEUCR|nr:hypothetical protein NCU16477 [Neurospora crassa OR74A]ESA44369.1 hypothetical protein NCU16477 [Neurospora crassa OR74A]KHE89342.1 hypothetical protein GE21DRAFT_2406 [Neurospora crassa]|eukprot:XP_011393436.1 hypothetical protein NCU16477 [Neurospora crassa OR74A]